VNAVGVVGAGSWGTALALVLARKGHDVSLWSYEEDVAEAVNRQRENTVYLPGVALPPRLVATTDIEEAVAGAPVVVSVSPSQHVARVMSEAAASLSPSALVVSASKGIETATLRTMAEVLDAVLPPAPAHSASFLSGPSFAVEVAREVPTAVTVASADRAAAARVQELFQTSYFRVYTVPDVTGVELGGALKNVIAIASGMAVGLGLGHNTQAALITRGLAEITRLGAALGGLPETLMGLAGAGDLILTATGDLSRNRRVGLELARGRKLGEILQTLGHVAEGVRSAGEVARLAAASGVDMPVTDAVNAVLAGRITPQAAVERLLARDPKMER